MSLKRMGLGVAVGMLLCLGAPTAEAAIELDFLPVDNSAALTGYTTYDMRVTTDTDWTGAAMLLELGAGGLYQHAQGLDSVADPAVIPSLYPRYPQMVFDTYVIGNIAGGGGDIGRRSTQLAFDTQRLDVSWFNIDSGNVGTTTIARLTFTDNAAGSMAILLSAGGVERTEFDISFVPDAVPVVTRVMEEEPADEEQDFTTPDLFEPRPRLPFEGSAYAWYSGREIIKYSDPLVWPETKFPLSREDLYGYGTLTSGLLKDRSGRLISRHELNPFNTFFVPPPDNLAAPNAAPEPSTLMLVGLCLGAASLRRR